MNSETDVTNTREFIDNNPSTECLNEVLPIESLCDYFMRHCDACPVFFMGSFQTAYQTAFNSTVIEERRPLLIYIHHDNSIWNDEFSSKIFCSEYIIDYLRANYILWSCDITYESNKNTLINIWREIFSNEFFIDVSVEQCPMLIGITRRSLRTNDTFLASQYKFELLLKGNTLMRTLRKLNLETFYDELIKFKEEFDENEQYLSFDFVRTTGLCWEIILEVVKYLSLNDAVTSFSTDILPLLWKYNIKLPIIEPSDIFMKTMIEKIDREQIVSLRLKAAYFKSTMELSSSTIFNNIKILTLLNLQQVGQINDFKIFFPNLTCLSLCYENEMDFHTLCGIFNHFQNSIKRLKIHCGYILCSHRRTDLIFKKINQLNRTIEYLLLDVAHMSMSLRNDCAQYYNTCVLKTTIDFIKIMPNIQYVHLIINEGNVERLLDVNEWKSLVLACLQLKKVRLQVTKSMSQDTQLVQQVLKIQKQLCNGEHTIKFEMKSK